MPATITDRLRRAGLAAVFGCAAASAEAAPCEPITALPYDITARGTYCLAGDLVYPYSTGAAIRILVDDVTLDLAGASLAGTAGPGTFALGVYGVDRRGVTVRNGTIRGFLYGVLLYDEQASDWAFGGGHVVRDLRLPGNYFRGVRAEGYGVVIERNFISDTGGTTVFGPGNYAFAIESYGPGARITKNVIAGVAAGTGGEAVGISISNSGFGTVVADNVIGNPAVVAQYRSFGVWIGGGSSVLLMDNRFTRLDIGAAYGQGTAGLFRDNASAGLLTLVRECDGDFCGSHVDNPAVIDAGNNN